MSDDLLTTTDAAALLKVSGETVRRWVEAGRIRHVRLPSGQLRFHRADIEDILEPIDRSDQAAS